MRRERDSVTDDLLESARESLRQALSLLGHSRRSLEALAPFSDADETPEERPTRRLRVLPPHLLSE